MSTSNTCNDIALILAHVRALKIKHFFHVTNIHVLNQARHVGGIFLSMMYNKARMASIDYVHTLCTICIVTYPIIAFRNIDQNHMKQSVRSIDELC